MKNKFKMNISWPFIYMGAQGAGHLGPYPGSICLGWVLTMGLGTWSVPEFKCLACFIYEVILD